MSLIKPTGFASKTDHITIDTELGFAPEQVYFELKSSTRKGFCKTACTYLTKDDVVLLCNALLEAVGEGTADPPKKIDPKCHFTALRETLMLLPESKPRSVALTKLEECLLWAAVGLRGAQNAFDVVGEGDE